MDLLKLRSILGWSTVINFALLFFFSIVLLIGKETIYTIWGAFFTISFEVYDVIIISTLAIWKTFVIGFLLVPYIAIGIVNKKK